MGKGTDAVWKAGELVLQAGLRTFSAAGGPTDGTSGTGTVGAYKAAAGSRYFDRTNKVWYTNIGTAASPAWVSDTMMTVLTLTSAQVKALRATPITLVAAPGAARLLEFVSIILLLDYGGSNVFAESTANLAVKYNDGAGAQVSQTIETTGFIDQAADTMTNGLTKIDTIVAKTGCENKPLVLHNLGAGEITGNAAGDSVVRVRTSYCVHVTGW